MVSFSGMTKQVSLLCTAAAASVRSGACHADIGEMEQLVRSITQDGLVWGSCKSVHGVRYIG